MFFHPEKVCGATRGLRRLGVYFAPAHADRQTAICCRPPGGAPAQLPVLTRDQAAPRSDRPNMVDSMHMFADIENKLPTT